MASEPVVRRADPATGGVVAETGTDLDAGVAFTTPLWLWEGDAAWHFVTLPEELSDAIEFRTAQRDQQRDFGSVRVEVTGTGVPVELRLVRSG